MIKDCINSDEGQTAVEYILILLVVVSLAMTMTRKVKEYLLPDGECEKASRSPLCEFQFTLQPPNYRYFTVLRKK